MPETVTFKQWTCKIVKRVHNDGTTAIELIDAATGEPVACPTVSCACVGLAKLKPGFILLKDYSENEGMLEALTSQGVVEDMRLPIPTGYVNVWLCKLLI